MSVSIEHPLGMQQLCHSSYALELKFTREGESKIFVINHQQTRLVDRFFLFYGHGGVAGEAIWGSVGRQGGGD
jgi:hypothetical protein